MVLSRHRTDKLEEITICNFGNARSANSLATCEARITPIQRLDHRDDTFTPGIVGRSDNYPLGE
jgi:hypothetical protein